MGLVCPLAPAQAAALLIVPTVVTNGWQVVGRRSVPCTSAVADAARHLRRQLARRRRPHHRRCHHLDGTLVSSSFSTRARIEHNPVFRTGAARTVVGAIDRRSDRVVSRGDWRVRHPRIAYLQALDLDKDELVRALGMMFMTSSIALAIVLVSDGVLAPSIALRVARGAFPRAHRHVDRPACARAHQAGDVPVCFPGRTVAAGSASRRARPVFSRELAGQIFQARAA